MTTPLKHARSGIASENLQEVLDSDARGAKLDYMMNGGQQQYCTPPFLCEQSQAKLPNRNPSTVLDPQCGEGDTINTGSWSSTKFGCDIDNRLNAKVPGVNQIG